MHIDFACSSTVGVCLLSWKKYDTQLDGKLTKAAVMESKYCQSIIVDIVNGGYERLCYV